MLTVLRRVFDFSSWYQSHPGEPPPGDMLDASFDAQDSKINEIAASIEGLRRSDGQLQNGIVTRDTLSPEIYGDLRFEMVLAAQEERKKAENSVILAQNAASEALSAQKRAGEAESRTLGAESAISTASSTALARISALIQRSEALLADLRAAEATFTSAESYSGESEAWAYSSALWAEHMPDTLPDNALKQMDITGDHWSSKWWANRADNAFGRLTDLYLGAWPDPPTQNLEGGPIEVGSIYYNTETHQMYVWTGSQWETMSQPSRAAIMALWYNASANQTVFPLTIPDLNGTTFSIDPTSPESLDAHVNGVKLMQKQAASDGDWSLDSATSTVTFLRPLHAGDIVSFDVLMANSKLGPGAMNAWSLRLVEAKDGSRTTFTMANEDVSGPLPTVSKNEELLVSVDGVIQEPGVSYSSISASISFVTAPAADSWVFITWFRAAPAGGSGSTAWADITGKPSTFPPTVPIAQADVTNLTIDLAGKVNDSGDTMTGKLNTALTATNAGINLGTPAADPSALVDGDIWMHATNGLQIRHGGNTYATSMNNAAQTFSAAKTFSVRPIMTTPTTSTGSLNLPHGIAPTGGSLANGDLWTTSAGGLFARINGASIGPFASTVSPTFTDGTLTKFQINATGIGFFAATPVARGAIALPTGTIQRTTYATASVTLPQLAGVVMAIITDLRAYGLAS